MILCADTDQSCGACPVRVQNASWTQNSDGMARIDLTAGPIISKIDIFDDGSLACWLELK